MLNVEEYGEVNQSANNILYYLGAVLQMQGKIEESFEKWEKYLTIDMKLLGDDHP